MREYSGFEDGTAVTDGEQLGFCRLVYVLSARRWHRGEQLGEWETSERV